MNWRRWGAAGLGVAVISTVAITLAVRHDGQVSTDAPASPGAVAQPVVPASSPSNGELRVIDQGFTQRDQPTELTLTPGYGPGKPEPYKPVYAAFTLENTSTVDIAAAPKVTITYYDDADQPIVAPDHSWTYTAPVLPGSSATFAGFLSIDSVRVTRMTVEVTGSQWLPAAAVTDRFAPLRAGGVTVLPATIPGLTTVTWTAGNDLATPVSAAGLLIYRDAAGKLLGAEGDTVGDTSLVLPPGDSTGSATFRTWFPPGTDQNNLQVTLRPGGRAPDL